AAARTMRARSARRLSVFPARTQLSSVERSSGVKVRAVGYLLIPNHDIDRFSLQLSTSDKPLSARRLRKEDSGDTASRQRLHDHESVRQGRGIGCSGRDAGLRSGFMQRLCNGSGFGSIYGCCTMMKINTFLTRRDV